MSQIPRRTSEFQVSSTRKSGNPRVSRIAQAAGGSAMRPGQSRASATPSMGRATPLRTPCRSNSKDRNTMVPMTAEKEKVPTDDRAFINNKTAQVLEELTKIDGFNDLIQKGLKSMTHKQFIMIIKHFLKPFGNIQIDGTNYTDVVYNFLLSMDYPYNINKSSLKTPSAPHCHGNIVVLLAWLADFSACNEDPEIEYEYSEDFSAPNIAENFMNTTAKAFTLWNNQQEAESEVVLDEMRQAFVDETVGPGEDLDTELDRLKSDIKDLNRNTKPVSVQEVYKQRKEELKALEEQTEELKRINHELSERNNVIQNEIKLKYNESQKVSFNLKKVRQALMNQKLSTEQKNELLIDISKLKTVLLSKKEAAKKLKEIGSENDIEIANLIGKKFQLIESLNNLIFILASNLNLAGMQDSFDPAAYVIKTKKITQNGELFKELKLLKEGLEDLTEKYRKIERNVNQDQINLVDEKHRLALGNSTQLNDLRSKFEQVEMKEKKLEEELNRWESTLQEMLKSSDAEISEIESNISIQNSNISECETLNAQIFNNIKDFKEKSIIQCKDIYEQRKKEAEDKRKRLNEINQLLEKFKKAQAVFPDTVQEVIDDVLEKRKEKDNSSNI
ncbi:CLUMA_CG021327, isoform A [Clunio marinus]|uniref:Kinetochore protein NDC80 n=1 Tax=Clunio marinus TaxID=568069 RepID=A0A1J1J7H0_9DIPT|nr:CLUMA_CG021327, isoform A [Clunio marinus]